jgi:hypothetical protein
MKLAALLLIVACTAGCKDAAVAPCTCKPNNVTRISHAGAPIDSVSVLALVRRHRTLVEDHAQGRDVKLVDDEIRLEMAALCDPCGDWVGERMTVDEMFPLARLDDATGVVCLGLTLRDGTTAFGERPTACRS